MSGTDVLPNANRGSTDAVGCIVSVVHGPPLILVEPQCIWPHQ